MTKKYGFTLIELLVVIAIIAILAAILFPVFARARDKARQTTCASNEKQLGLAFLQYSQDYDEYLPMGCGPYAEGIGWAGQLYAYVKSAGVYACPSDTTPSPSQAGCYTISYASNRTALGYYYGNSTGAPGPGPGALSRFTSPTRTVLLFEIEGGTANRAVNMTNPLEGGCVATQGPGNSTFHINYSPSASGAVPGLDWGGFNAGDYITGPMPPLTVAVNGQVIDAGFLVGFNKTNADGRHLPGSNFLMADGHVKWLVGTQVSSGSVAPTQASAAGAGSVNSVATAEGVDATAHAVTFSWR